MARAMALKSDKNSAITSPRMKSLYVDHTTTVSWMLAMRAV